MMASVAFLPHIVCQSFMKEVREAFFSLRKSFCLYTSIWVLFLSRFDFVHVNQHQIIYRHGVFFLYASSYIKKKLSKQVIGHQTKSTVGKITGYSNWFSKKTSGVFVCCGNKKVTFRKTILQCVIVHYNGKGTGYQK